MWREKHTESAFNTAHSVSIFAQAAAGVGAASPGVAAEDEELRADKAVRKEFVCDEAAEFGKTAFRPRAGPPASRGPARCR